MSQHISPQAVRIGAELHAAFSTVVVHLSSLGLSAEEVCDGMLIFAAMWESNLLGPDAFAERLRDLALKFEEQARSKH